MNRVKPIESPKSQYKSNQDQPKPLKQHQLQNIGTRRAQRFSDTEVMPSQLRAIRHHAIDTGCRQDKRDNREHARKCVCVTAKVLAACVPSHP